MTLTQEELNHPGIQAIAAMMMMACDELTDQELAALNIAVQLDQNPQGRIYDYDKVSHLFTEADGTRMHDAGKQILAAIVTKRLA